MAMTDDLDPNDPATVLRNKIKAQVSPAGSPDPTQPAVEPSAAPKATSPVPNVPTPYAPPDTADQPKQGVTDPAFTPPAPPAATTNTGFTIPTNPDGTQVGGGIPWGTGADSQPLYAPPGYHWDRSLASFQAGDDPKAARPTGGKLTDPGFAAAFVNWAGNQPGVNPSVKNDPQYWIGRFTAGAFGDDQNEAVRRMMQAEGAPEGGGAAAPAVPMPAATSPFTEQIRKLLMERMGRDTAPVNESDNYIAQPYAAANLEAQRNQQMERTALAERAAAQGDTSGTVNMGIQQSAERNAVGLGSLKANLIAKEYASRRADLSDAMQAALASGDRETAAQLQMALAQLDAQLRREGYGVNMSEFEQQQNNHTVGAV